MSALSSTQKLRKALELKTAESQMRGELLNHSEDLLVSVVEFLNDWRKGDFDLPKLAKLDADVMSEKAIKFSSELRKHQI